MGYGLLDAVVELLKSAGLRAGEEYPAGERVEVLSPVAAVGLRELDTAAGEARFTVRILSPRILGGWCCQVHAAKGSAALRRAGLTVQSGEMEYLNGSDCFCVVLTAVMAVTEEAGSWGPGQRWKIFCGGEIQEGVVSFRVSRDQGRRVVGAFCQEEPVKVTPGRGGWELELVQQGIRETAESAEPFVLTAREGEREYRYSGCCWNETILEHTQGGLRRTRRGFALRREVTELG